MGNFYSYREYAIVLCLVIAIISSGVYIFFYIR